MQTNKKPGPWKPLVLRQPLVVFFAMALLVVFLVHNVSRSRSKVDEKQPDVFKPMTQIYDTERRETSDQSAYTFVYQMAGRLREMSDNAVMCLRDRCSKELAACRDNEDCRVALRHFTRKCWVQNTVCDELTKSGLVSHCPVSAFDGFWQCYDQACSLARRSDTDTDIHGPHLFSAKDSKVNSQDMQALSSLAAKLLPLKGDREAVLGMKAMEEAVPRFVNRIRKAAEEADTQMSTGIWTLLRDIGQAQPTLYKAKLLSFDAEDPPERLTKSFQNLTLSLITAVIPLPSPSSEAQDSSDGVEIAIMSTSSPCAPKVSHTVHTGEVLVFESWREYDIVPASNRRQVLMIEYWEFSENQDDHSDEPVPDGQRLTTLSKASSNAQARARRWFAKHLVQAPPG